MLDLDFNRISKYYEASLQLKANNGIFILDDFGRQQVDPRDILNRWIVPLDRHIDYMTLHTGMKFVIPFDMLVVFATNIDPKELLDEAFLRRIRYKVAIDRPSKEEYLEIFKMVCESNAVTFDQEVFDYLVEQCYPRYGTIPNACHPRDLIEQIIVESRYFDTPARLTRETIEMACANYFVKMRYCHCGLRCRDVIPSQLQHPGRGIRNSTVASHSIAGFRPVLLVNAIS